MFTVSCRFIFRKYTAEQISRFLQECEEHTFDFLTNFHVGQSVHYGTSNEEFDERDETEFFFDLKSPEELGLNSMRTTKYKRIVLAFTDLVKTFETLQQKYENNGLAHDASVLFTLLSHDIYPKFFPLQSSFSGNKLGFGNIVNNRYFAPTFLYDEPQDVTGYSHDVFEKYLMECRGMENVDANMLMICEHDLYMLTFCFPDILSPNLKLAEHRSADRVIDIKIPYSAIRRLIVTPKCDNQVTFTFQLNYAPSIYIHEKGQNRAGKAKLYFKPPSRYLTWNKGLNLEDTISHASCMFIETRDVVTRTLLDCLDRFRKKITYSIEYRFLNRLPNWPLRKYTKNVFMDQENLPDELFIYTNREYFPLVFAVQALICRNGAIYDYFFRTCFNKFDEFLNLVTESFKNDLLSDPDTKVTKTVIALEHMLQLIDRLNDTPEPISTFKSLYDAPGYRMLAEVTSELDKKGYMRVRRVVVTPTRTILINPELIMGNRSLRQKGADEMLRLVFRDDNGMRLSGLPQFFLTKTIKETLSFCMDVGFRHFSYLASSNSQFRDHGCYLLAGSTQDAQVFRQRCGKLKAESVPKMMSRIAQFFTQSRECGILITRKEYSETFDYTGGADSNGKAYTFSDGCGLVSKEFCEKIVQDFHLGDCIPSCYQIRFRGYKGVVTIYSLMDEVREWAKKNGIFTGPGQHKSLPWYAQSLLFRPSQMKFKGPTEKHVEIVKMSSPIAVSLNKPLINILDQVSEMHGPESHKRMRDRIFQLLENDLEKVISALVDEPAAFLTLNEFPQYILYDRLKDFYITEEPFFRSMLRSAALVGLHQLVDKMQIRIPTSQGRMMFGVVDESGVLQYGQVFFKYTTNASVKYPGHYADKVIHTGRVLITKNPSIVAGDVRMFDAVDIPCLHDLVDVIVFPQAGPRPHPDEMAGSDLDGDEYSIFWDPLLFLDRNEPAFDFTPPPAAKPSNPDEIIDAEKMIAFFTSYVSKDSIGAIANAHLANSDLYGINSKHCHNIAIKHNQAVDFPKSGQVPAPLTKSWGDGMPPEKMERYPNFMAKSSQAMYKSVRLLGDLYNRVTEIHEMVRIEDLISADEDVKLDESILLSDDDEFIYDAENAYTEYCTLIGGLMETYGIANEGQLFSGRFTALKKQLTDKENDNFDMYNTQHMIENQLAEIYARFREQFFEAFGGIDENTEFDELKSNGTRDAFRRFCSSPNLQLRKKASAYYRIAYKNQKFLSFGWLAGDILVYNRKQYLLQPDNRKFSLYPLNDRLSDYINETCSSPEFKSQFEQFTATVDQVIEDDRTNVTISLQCAQLCKYFIGLTKLLFFIRLWAKKHDIQFNLKLLDALFVKFGLGEFQKGGGWLNIAEGINHTAVNVESQLGGIGKKFWDFIQFIMTRQFGDMKQIDFELINIRNMDETHCKPLYYAAVDTFYSIAVNRRFENLPGGVGNAKMADRVSEGSIFIIEIPRSAEDYQKLCRDLAEKCGCIYAVVKKRADQINPKSFRVSVKPVGTFIAVRKFRSLLEVTLRMSESNLERRSNLFAVETYRRLVFYNRPDKTIDDDFEM